MSVKPTTSPELAFISIGSNIDPEKYLPRAIGFLHSLGILLRISCVYQNPALDRPEQPDFLNAAALIETNHKPLELKERLRKIESELDRIRSEDKYAARTIDLDLCLLGDRIYQSPDLQLPDPDILKHGHLAIPLSELDKDFVHPITGETLEQIASKLRPSAHLTLRKDVSILANTAAAVSDCARKYHK